MRTDSPLDDPEALPDDFIHWLATIDDSALDAQTLDHCAPIVSDPLLPVRLVIERAPKGPCAEKQAPLVLSPLTLRERHVRVMRHLRERPALP